jgi:hypothetical protein
MSGFWLPSLPNFAGTTFRRLRSSTSAHTGRRMVTSKAEEYRAKALECEERAEQTRDPFVKQQLIEIAEKWRHMATHLEKYSR